MSSYLQWIILSSLTRSPLLSAFIVLGMALVTERMTIGILPSPFRFIGRFRRELSLRKQLKHNIHDRRSRLELAILLNERKSFHEAVTLLRPNLDQGDSDIVTLFTFGTACIGAKHFEQGKKFLLIAQNDEPKFRVGEIDLALGRAHLQRREFQDARLYLETFVAIRKGTVEGRVLLSQSVAGLGDDATAALIRDTAWHEHETAARYQQKKERFWAWRARPSRPLFYGICLIVVAVFFVRGVKPYLQTWAEEREQSQMDDS
jgi:tetratricopeptide (TPR) repeat protein